MHAATAIFAGLPAPRSRWKEGAGYWIVSRWPAAPPDEGRSELAGAAIPAQGRVRFLVSPRRADPSDP